MTINSCANLPLVPYFAQLVAHVHGVLPHALGLLAQVLGGDPGHLGPGSQPVLARWIRALESQGGGVQGFEAGLPRGVDGKDDGLVDIGGLQREIILNF